MTVMPRTGLVIAGILLLILLPVALYAPLLDNEWVDDDILYPWGAQVHRLDDLPRLFTTDISKVWRTRHYDYDAYAGGSDYRPVGYLYFAALYPFFGMSAPAYRVVNFLVYGVGTLLVLVLVYRLTGRPLLAWLTAVLFAVDPMRLEYVTVLSFQGGLVLVFYLAGVLCYLKARTTPEPTLQRRLAYGLSCVAAAGAYFTYELALSLPFILLLVEGWGWWSRRQWRFQPGWVLPHALLAGLYLWVRTLVESRFYAERGTVMFSLTNPYDLLFAWIHMVSRVIMLFVPEFPTWRHQFKAWLMGTALGDVATQTILATHPLLTAATVGLLAASLAVILWLGTRPRVWRFLRDDPRGHTLLLAVGWLLFGLAATFPINQLGPRYLIFSAVGADLLRAIAVVALGEWCLRRWAGDPRWLAAGLLTPFMLYSANVIVTDVRVWNEMDRVNKTLIADAVRIVREAAVDDRPIVVYYVNGVWGNMLFLGLQEAVQHAVGREDIRVVLPYALSVHAFLFDRLFLLPQVTIGPSEIMVVNHPERPQPLSIVYYDFSQVRTGLTVRNGDLYTLEVLEADDLRRIPIRLVIRYARPPGTRLLFVKFEGGRLVRQDAD